VRKEKYGVFLSDPGIGLNFKRVITTEGLYLEFLGKDKRK
jgi:hypothetical protein